MMNDCDLWKGSTISGYGRLHIAVIDGKQIQILAHRLVYQQTFGHTDLCILHSCDTPACINIEHLRAGTYQDNMDDMMQRGRSHQASQTHCKHGHKFTEENTYIRKTGRRQCRECDKEKKRQTRKQLNQSASGGRPT